MSNAVGGTSPGGRGKALVVIVPSLIVGVTDALSMRSFQSIVPSIVERDQIASGIALNSTQFNLSRILGPTLAGILMTSVGAIGCFAVSAASYVPFILVALWILPRGQSGPVAEELFDRRHPFAGMLEIAREPNLRGALLTVLVSISLCGPLITFCPVLVKEAFNSDVSHFSIALGAFGVGGLLRAFGLLFVDANRDRRPLSNWFAMSYGVTVIVAAVSPWIWRLSAVLLLAGVSMTVSNTSANSLLQATAPARLRGQTVSLYMLVMRGGVSIGSLMTGISVHLLGIRHALLINGVIAVVANVLIGREWFRSRSMKPTS
jgi:predicted MFS family arabinose efflux permease